MIVANHPTTAAHDCCRIGERRPQQEPPIPRARDPRRRLRARRARPRATRARQHASDQRAAHLRHPARWNADPEGDVAGYEVVWRDSIELLWKHVRFVGNVTEYTIAGLNKDDYQVGVRAVDRNGNRSPAAFAGPASL